MNLKSLVFSFAITGLLVFWGCERHPDKPGIYYSDKSISFEKMGMRDAIVIVNGKKLTKCDFIDRFKADDKVYRLQTRQPLAGEADESEMAIWMPHIVMGLIRHELFDQYADKMRLEPTEEAVQEATRQLMQSLKRPAAEKFESLCAQISGREGRLFKRLPYENARDHLLRQSVTTNDLSKVTDAELKARENYVKNFDANAERLNKEQRAKLSKAREEMLKPGASFKDVARRASEISPEHGEEWQTVELGELPKDEDLYKWLSQAKVGEISQPLDLQDGLALVKLVSMAKGAAPAGVPPPDVYALVKCTVKAFEHMQFQTREQMRAQLLLWKRQEANQVLGTKLFNEAVIEYPNGTNFFPMVESTGRDDKGVVK